MIPDSLLSEEQLEHLAGMMALIFMKMNRDQRRASIKMLKALRPNLDTQYPNGRPDEAKTSGIIVPPGMGEPKSGPVLIVPK